MTRISKTLLPGLFLLGAFLIAAAPAMANDHRNHHRYAAHHSVRDGHYRSRYGGADHHKRPRHAPQSWAWRPRARYPHYYRHYPRGYAGFHHGPRYRRHFYAGYAPWFVYPRPVVSVWPYISIYSY